MVLLSMGGLRFSGPQFGAAQAAYDGCAQGLTKCSHAFHLNSALSCSKEVLLLSGLLHGRSRKAQLC